MPQSDLTGGCQCGAVRFSAKRLGRATICHCRMCQKAVGNYFAPFVAFEVGGVTWTRGNRKLYRSSNHVSRAFCADCGTPLTYEAPDGVALTIAAFDDPAEIAPRIQWGIEAKLPYVDAIPGLPGEDTMADQDAASFLADLVSYQHPDHDTETWPDHGTNR